MKQFITLQSIKSDSYSILQVVDLKFYLIYQMLECHFYLQCFSEPNFIEWLYNTEKTVGGNEFFDIRKKNETVALYDRSEWLEDEAHRSMLPDENKRYDMSYQNFKEILLRWEELRMSMPEIILLVIHEDNYISLETDIDIIKLYHNAGYAFDINKA
jgi:hypothetical protein